MTGLSRVTRGNRFARKSPRPPRQRSSRRHGGDAFVSCSQFPRCNFLRERRTRGRSSPSFRQKVAAACQSPDRSAASRTTILAFRFGDFSHDAHVAHLRIVIDDREDVRGKGRDCASDRSLEAIAGDTIEWCTSSVNRYDSFTSVYCGFGVDGNRKLLPGRRKRLRGTKV